MRRQVAIVGGGPSGLLLSLLLHRQGIDSVVVERRSQAHVLARVRAGLLERGTVAALEAVGAAGRLHREGLAHDGCVIAQGEDTLRIDFAGLTGHRMVIYGQTEVTRDLYAARRDAGLDMVFEASGVRIEGADGDAPRVAWDGGAVDCDWIAGCDGFHGMSRRSIPEIARVEHERVYPFGWLGVLSETPPVHEELVYARSEAGFALCSMRSPTLSRYYVQCGADDAPGDWPDDRVWDTLRRSLPAAMAGALVTGPSVEKSVAPLRSFVCEPMRWGRIALAGDAAHIVPPTGAKGLNLAVGDVRDLADALAGHYAGDAGAMDGYSARALARVWKAERFSWWMTQLLHRVTGQDAFARRLQDAEMAHLAGSPSMRETFAWNYVGLDR